MNLKLTICSWILFFIILNSDTHASQQAEYSGTIVEIEDPLHPSQICKKALNESLVYWSFGDNPDITCSSNIKCRKVGGHEEISLTEKPVNGVICDVHYDEVDKNFAAKALACYNEKCIPIA